MLGASAWHFTVDRGWQIPILESNRSIRNTSEAFQEAPSTIHVDTQSLNHLNIDTQPYYRYTMIYPINHVFLLTPNHETDELSTSKQTSSALGQRLTSDLRRFVAMKVARKCTKPSIGEKWVETWEKAMVFGYV
jgi:hypothetical protein